MKTGDMRMARIGYQCRERLADRDSEVGLYRLIFHGVRRKTHGRTDARRDQLSIPAPSTSLTN